MVVDELESHLADAGYATERLIAPDGNTYVVIKNVLIAGGSLAGRTCDVAVLRTTEIPWVPQAALHVRPLLVPMGQHSTQGSPLGSDWQYWSRRFDKVPTARNFLAHVLTVLGDV